MAKSPTVTIRVPPDLLAVIDAHRGNESRTGMILYALREHFFGVREYRTKSGRVLTDADIEALADEAEKGYDVEALKRKPPRKRPTAQADPYTCPHKNLNRLGWGTICTDCGVRIR